MSIWWLKLNIVDREIGGRSYAERRAAAADALRSNTRAFADFQTEGDLPTFFLFSPANMSILRKAIQEAIAHREDVALIGRISFDPLSRLGGGTSVKQFEGLFDDVWRK